MKYTFISIIVLFVITTTEISTISLSYNKISCFKIDDTITFLTFDFVENTITNVSLGIDASHVQIAGVLEQTTSSISLFYIDLEFNYHIGYYYFENNSFIEGPKLPFPFILFTPQPTFYNQQSNQILIGGVDSNIISTIAYNIKTNQLLFTKTNYQIYDKLFPIGGVGLPNEILTFYYSGQDSGLPYLLVTNATTKNSINYKVEGYKYDSNDPPYVYPLMSNSGQIYFVSVDFPNGNRDNSLSLYIASLENSNISLKPLFSIPYTQYSNGNAFLLDETRENIILIVKPTSKQSEIQFITYNLETNTISNTSLENDSDFSFDQYSNYFTR